jgi:hypothetical protein
MSLEAKATMTVGALTILLTIVSSMAAGLWIVAWDLSEVHKQVELNHKQIQRMDEKIEKITTIMIGEKQ